jgi:uncharacterized membrane protein
MSDSDFEKHKMIAILGYIFPILFIIPLVTDAKESPFAKFHANQHLVLFISYLVVSLAGGFIFAMMRMFFLISLCHLALFVLAVMAAISTSRGEMKPLPVIGGIELIK